MGWIPKCMPRWNANQFTFLKFPSLPLTDGCHINQAVNQGGQWSSGMAPFFFLSVFFFFSGGTQKSFTQERKKKENVHPFTTSPISTIVSIFIFSISHLKSRALPLEGSMNLGKTAAFLEKKKKRWQLFREGH